MEDFKVGDYVYRNKYNDVCKVVEVFKDYVIVGEHSRVCWSKKFIKKVSEKEYLEWRNKHKL